MSPPEEARPSDEAAPPVEEAVEPTATGSAESEPEARPAEDEVKPREPLTEEEMSYLEQLQRLQAEFSNYRRRIQRERLQWEDRAKGQLLAGLLPILDDIGRAKDSIGSGNSSKDVEGLLLILGRLEEALTSAGLEMQPIKPGVIFDPHQHEAVMTEASEEHEEGSVTGVVQPGYVYREQLLRPAKVQVSRGPEESD